MNISKFKELNSRYFWIFLILGCCGLVGIKAYLVGIRVYRKTTSGGLNTITSKQVFNPTQVVCRIVEQCWHLGQNRTTAVFIVQGNGTFTGERYDVWKAAPDRLLIGYYSGSVPTGIVNKLAASARQDPRWERIAGDFTYAYGIDSYGKFDHPKVIGEFLSIALNSTMLSSNSFINTQ